MLDVKSAYPFTEIFLNISKATTRREISKIEGVDEETKRAIALNLTGGRVNSVETCTRVLGLKPLHELEAEFLADLDNGFSIDSMVEESLSKLEGIEPEKETA